MAKKQLGYYEVKLFSSIKEMLCLAEQEAGDVVAYKYKEKNQPKQATYKEFAADVRALGTAVKNLGISDKHISCIGENSYKWILCYLSTLCGDNVYCPVDKELPAKDVINVINTADSVLVFCADKHEKMFKENREQFPNVRKFVVFGKTEDEGDFLSFDKFIASGRAQYSAGDKAYDQVVPVDDKTKLIVFTSGTTGHSKGVMLTEHNLVSSVYYGLQVSSVKDCGLSVLPYHHTYEAVCDLLVSIHKHTTLCINDSMAAILKNLQTYKPYYIYIVPAFAEVFYKKIWATATETGKAGGLKFLIKLSNGLRKIGIDCRKKFFASIKNSFGGNLTKIVCGGAPIREEVGKFFDSIGIILINGYGITECSPLVAVNREEINDPSTVGRLLPCLQVKFVDVDSDGIGEICVKGDVVMKGYYKNPEATAAALVDGWFHTGDFGKMQGDFLVITGRKKNIIVLSNGKNIYPEELEEYIQNIPYVKENVVYALRDENDACSGLAAELYLDSEAVAEFGDIDVEEKVFADIRKAISALPVYKQITEISLRDEPFEKNSSNKILRKK